MTTTKLVDLINPEVMADMISAELPSAIKFLPLASVDNTLVGQPGNTITVPKFKYIGDATVVAEGQPIEPKKLQTTSFQATVKKVGQGVELTDEAVLSGYGDPVGEGNKQMKLSIAAGVDNDILAALETATLEYKPANPADSFTLDVIDNAIAVFNDEDPEAVVLMMNPKDALKLRKNVGSDWVRPTELGDNIVIKGTFGEVLGAQVVRTNKLPEGIAYLVKQGALKLYMKRAVEVETDRDILAKMTVATADQHFTAYLYDETKVVRINVQIV
ncbi:N4-gp56 family major capsid protein [Shigella flexneri]|nr:N4-gp56 family major capsid protein [Shigella flexneri]